MAGLDLSGIKRLVDSWLVDQVLITRDNGEHDDVLDEETGQLTPTDAIGLYYGDGMVQSLAGFSEVPDPDVQRIVEATDADYRALIPLEVGIEFVVGDAVRVMEQRGTTVDPKLTRRRFQIVDTGGASSWNVLQVLYLKQVDVVSLDPDPADAIPLPVNQDGKMLMIVDGAATWVDPPFLVVP
jgi:hypothetical protein